jgi:hypothetical protein
LTGRYVTPDPIGLEGGINLFSYTENNPVTSIDPEGLHWWVPNPRSGAIPHRHQSPNGPITIVNSRDPGAWPGDSAHYGPKPAEDQQAPPGLLQAIESFYLERSLKQLAEGHNTAAFIDVSGASAVCLARCMAGPSLKHQSFEGVVRGSLVAGSKRAIGATIGSYLYYGYEAYECIKKCKEPCQNK